MATVANHDISPASRTTTPVCQFTESTAPPPPHVAVIVMSAPSEVGTPVIVVLFPGIKFKTPELDDILVPDIRYS